MSEIQATMLKLSIFVLPLLIFIAARTAWWVPIVGITGIALLIGWTLAVDRFVNWLRG